MLAEQIQFCYRNPSAVEATDDFLTLPHLDEPNILHSLRVRYTQGHVYSYTGPILIAVNPWRQVEIYYILYYYFYFYLTFCSNRRKSLTRGRNLQEHCN